MCITSLSLVISKIHKVYKHNGDTYNSKSLKTGLLSCCKF